MAHGLVVYNESGQVVFDTSDRLLRYVAQYTMTLRYENRIIYVPGMVNDGTWIVVASTDAYTGGATGGYRRLPVSIQTGYFIVSHHYADALASIIVSRA